MENLREHVRCMFLWGGEQLGVISPDEPENPVSVEQRRPFL